MKKLLLSIIAILSLQFTQAQTTNPCGLYFNGYNQTANYTASYCGGDSINLLVQAGGGAGSSVIMTLNAASSLITSNSSIQFNGLQQPTFNISFLAPYLTATTTYNFTLTLLDTSCTDAGSQSFTANYSITIYATTQMNLYFPTGICQNANPISLTQGYPVGGVYSGNGVTQSGTSYYFDPILAGVGTHTITYAVSLGTPCDSVITDNIVVKAAPSVSVSDTAYCKYAPFPVVSPIITGGVSPYTYSWQNLGNGNLYTTPSLATTAATYSLEVTASNGCTDNTTFTVTENPLPITSISSSSYCLPSTLSQVPTYPNYTYLWNTGATTPSIYATTSMIYHLWVTDTTTGCMADDSIALCSLPLGCPSQSDISCPGDVALLCFNPCDSLAALNYQYTWSTGATTNCISTTIAGNYSLTVYDPISGTTSLFNFIVNAASLNAQILGRDSLYCMNEQITLSSGAVPVGTNFQWTTSTGYTPVNSNLSGISFAASLLGVGTHQIYLMVQDGICIDYDTLFFEIMPNVSGIVSDSIICFGDSVHLMASPQDTSFTYYWLWYDGGVLHTDTNASITFLPTTANAYALNVNNGACATTYMVYIPFYNNFNAPFIGDTLMCAGDSTDIAVNLPNSLYSFQWMTGDTTAGITAYFGGTYTVDVTLNSIGCTVNNSINITAINPPNAQTIYGDTNMCGNGLDSLWTDSLSGLHYTWTGNVQDTMLYVNGSGIYSLLITDTTTNCSAYQEIEVTEFPSEHYYIFPEPDTVICQGDSVYLAVLDSVNNASPLSTYSILWNTGATTGSIVVGTTGTYWAAVTDLNGCADTAFINITVNTLPTITIVNVPFSSTGACEDSTLLVLTSSSTNINLNNSSWANDSMVAYQSGTIWATVVDSNGCSAIDSITVSVDLACCDAPEAYIRLEQGGNSADLMAQNVNNSFSSSFYNDTILIKDTLYVNNAAGLYFNGCNIIMGPYAVIWVEGGDLEIIKSHIHSCNDTMWQGIYVNSNSISIRSQCLIEDAIETVVISPNSLAASYSIYDSFFKNNIYTLICNPPTVGTSVFRGNRIFNPDFLKINPAGVDSSFTGIFINNVYGLTIGSHLNPYFKNYFEDLQYGIVAIRSIVEVYNNHFENIHHYHSNAINTNYNIALNSACVYGRGWSSLFAPFSSTIGSTAQNHKNTFTNFSTGVYSEMLNTDVIGNNFSDGTNIGVYTQTSNLKTINIKENYMQDVRVGVGALDNIWATYNVIDNEIAGQSQQQFLGISIANWSVAGLVNLDVSKNCIDNYVEGIGQGFVNDARIEANFIKDTDYGIASNTSYNGVIQSNRVVGSNSSHLNGTYAYLSEQVYQCNSIENYRTAMYFRGSCVSRLQQNSLLANLSYSDNGIMIDYNGSIGIQGAAPSWMTPAINWDNQWSGFGGSGGISHIHTDNNTTGALSDFYVRWAPLFIPLLITANTSTLVSYTTIPFPLTWPTCSALPSCNFKVAPTPINNVELTDLEMMEFEALGEAMNNPDEYQNKEKLYRDLLERPELADSSLILENFRDSVEQTDMGRLIRIEKAIVDSAYVEAAAINDSILGVNNIEITAKDFYAIHLAPYLRGEAAIQFTASELADMRYIANLCPFTHGKVVFAARNLCRYHDTLWVDYRQPCETTIPTSSRLAAPEQEADVFKVYPNPAKDRVNIKIKINDSDILLKLHLVNNLGQVIETHQATSRQELSIAVSHLPSGIYLLNLADQDGSTIATQKLTKE